MRGIRAIGCLCIAALVWVHVLQLGFAAKVEELAAPLGRRQLALWQDSRELAMSMRALRRGNPEWDLMARMFAVLSFAELAQRDPAHRAGSLKAIDRILRVTLGQLEEHKMHWFLLPYSTARPFVDAEQRSLFIDGEIAMMLATRLLLAPSAEHAAAARPWVARVAGQLERAPHLVAESYPDEAWIFCNTVALAALRLYDVATGATTHTPLIDRWLAHAQARLLDRDTGLLVAKTSYAAEPLEGPEGSTLWLAATMLLVLDERFARQQYERARAELRGSFAGFGWAREWPRSAPGAEDVDSGPTIPLVEANAGSSGLALVAASAFDDHEFAEELVASLRFAGFPVDGGERFAAGNQLSDAIFLWASVFGPTWARVRGGAR